MTNQPDPSNLGARSDPAREPDAPVRYPPRPLVGGQQLPDIPKTVSWATALLILGAIPVLLLSVDNILLMPGIEPSADFPARSDEAVLLFTVVYLMLAVSLLNGRRRTRITVAVMTAVFYSIMVTILAGLDLHLGLVGESGESDGGAVSAVFWVFVWTFALSGIGLALLHTPSSSAYITRSEAYQSDMDQQNTSRTSR